jgi:hypothetical protein
MRLKRRTTCHNIGFEPKLISVGPDLQRLREYSIWHAIIFCKLVTKDDSMPENQGTCNPCGKQRFREIARPDWVRTLRTCTHTQQYVRFVKWPTPSGLAISRNEMRNTDFESNLILMLQCFY